MKNDRLEWYSYTLSHQNLAFSAFSSICSTHVLAETGKCFLGMIYVIQEAVQKLAYRSVITLNEWAFLKIHYNYVSYNGKKLT